MVSSRFLLLLLALSCCVCGLELHVAHSSYQAEEEQSLTLDWTFTPKPDPSLRGLSVFCAMITESKVSVLLDLQEGVEISGSQSEEFSGRVQWDRDPLKEGRIRLHVSSLRTEDSGWYQCQIPSVSGSSLDKCLLSVTERSQTMSEIKPETANAQSREGMVVRLGLSTAAVMFCVFIVLYFHRKR